MILDMLLAMVLGYHGVLTSASIEVDFACYQKLECMVTLSSVARVCYPEKEWKGPLPSESVFEKVMKGHGTRKIGEREGWKEAVADIFVLWFEV
nr:unnamed protein product [Callosobruchus chinensis]